MALGSALVDRARIYRKAAAVKVENRTIFAQLTLAWFRCRLDLRESPEQPEGESRVKRAVKTPQLLVGARDLEGKAIDIRATDRLEVVSPQLGTAYWEVTSDPEPLRKKRRVIGYQVTLRRLEEHEFDPTLANV